jgi:DNA-directed RNA polymerase subunit RPC12/RpoP
MSPDEPELAGSVYESCPHCGQQLSPWEKILLSVDRALMCRHCWYRITLNAPVNQPTRKSNSKPKGPEK